MIIIANHVQYQYNLVSTTIHHLADIEISSTGSLPCLWHELKDDPSGARLGRRIYMYIQKKRG